MDRWSATSSGSTLAGSRLTVILFSSRKLAIPVDASTSFADVEAEVLRRAARLKINVPDGDYEFHLDSDDGPLAFPDDLLVDVMEIGGNPTIWFQMAEGDPAQLDEDGIFMRWITPARAINYSTLEDIPLEVQPIPAGTTISELKRMGKERIYMASDSTEAPLTPEFKLELFLTLCALRNTDEEHTTLKDLGCSGTKDEPLQIYIVPVTNKFADDDNPQDLWPFESSGRGICTFLTCLKTFMAEGRSKPSTHRRLMKTIWSITHFPPALEALQLLNELNRLEPRAVSIVVACFRELALRMIPSAFIQNDIKQVLQGSRQVFAWVESIFLTTQGDVDDPEATLVRAITLSELDKRPDTLPYQAGYKTHIVEIDAAGDAGEGSSSSHPRCNRIVSAKTIESCHENMSMIAIALWGQYDAIENYYIDFGGYIASPLTHVHTPRPGHLEFPKLMRMANQSASYQMLRPKSLDNTFKAGITLSTEGYVCQFGMSAGDFKEQKKFTWNIINGTEIFEAAPGDNIHKALQSIITSRKNDGTWELDDWETPQAEVESPLDLSVPQEAIVICFDLSYSMDNAMGHSWIDSDNDFTKLTECKQVFENVVGRMLGYQLVRNFVGVVTFAGSNQISRVHELSKINSTGFGQMAKDMKTLGMTAIWDALMTAKSMLCDFKQTHPSTKLRIIALTDGGDNQSTNAPADVCRALCQAEIVLDSIVIGSSTTADLFKMSKHTGGYAFNPSSRSLLFQTFLLEPFLDISARPDIERIPVLDYQASKPREPDMKTIYDIPPCRPHPLEAGSFIDLREGRNYYAATSSPLVRSHAPNPTLNRRPVSSLDVGGTLLSRLRSARLSTSAPSIQSNMSRASSSRIYQSEIAHMATNLPGDADVYVNESDMSFWKVVLVAPADTSYAGATFVLTVQMSPEFPQLPPTVRFATPILHPNITKHGRVCHQIFTKGWKSSYHVLNVLDYMRDLLKEPMMNDAVDELASTKFWTDKATADSEIRKYVNRFAKQSRSVLKNKILSGNS